LVKPDFNLPVGEALSGETFVLHSEIFVVSLPMI
jgi:hypothetical protein